MKKLNESELNSLINQSGMRGANEEIYRVVKNLEIGEGMTIDTEEWKTKTSPSMVFSQYGARWNKKFMCRTITGGWVIKRIK